MIRSIRSALIGLMVMASLAIGAVAVGATCDGSGGNPCTASSSATISAGALAITTGPANFSYSATLDGTDQTKTSAFSVGVSDATGTGAGWKLQALIGTLSDGNSHTIAAAGHKITGATPTTGSGTGPTNSIGYALVIPTTTNSIFNAAANSGMGQSTISFATSLVIPAQTAAGTYSATLTVTIVSGP